MIKNLSKKNKKTKTSI